MAIQTNRSAITSLSALIEAGKVDTTGAWSFGADDGNALLGKSGDDWAAFGAVHLGIDSDAADETKARYAYPVAKAGKVFLAGLRAAITRASQNDATDVADAARKLLLLAHSKMRSTEHAGFADWIEVFQSGKHTDSAGATRTWSQADLDQIVAAFDAEQPAPLVIGHPTNDSPAYGWTSALKRTGNKLLAKFTQVPQSVSDAVRDGRYRNRSVKLSHTADGWKLIHVGLLGAAPPAVAGLAPIAFEAEPAGVTYQFDALDAAGLNVIARGLQKLRELIIAHFGQDEADTYAPQDQIDSLNNIADAHRAQPADDDDQPQAAAAFAAQADEDRKMDEKLKADLDAKTVELNAANAKLAEFTARERVAEAKQTVDAALAEGRLLPAQAQGLAEFMASEPDGASFEFAAGGDKLTKPRGQFLREFIAGLPKQIELGRKIDGTDAVADDPEAIVKAAREFQASEKAKGIDIAWHEAVTHVTAQGH